MFGIKVLAWRCGIACGLNNHLGNCIMRVEVDPESIPGTLDMRQGYTLDKTPVHTPQQ